METKGRIFIVEDEPNIVGSLQRILQPKGYQTAVETNGRRAYERIIQENYDLILLDVMLPDMDGFEICQKVREMSDVPIMMLTARGEQANKNQGLKLGAYEYMTKPFDSTELLLRIEGIIGRAKNPPRPDEKRLVVGNIILYPERYEVTVKGQKVDLTAREFDLLKYLVENKNIVLSRDQILEKVWDYNYIGTTTVVDVYIRYLRAKIDEKYEEKHIHTVRGVGYVVRD